MTTFHFNRRDLSFRHNLSVSTHPSTVVLTSGVILHDVRPLGQDGDNVVYTDDSGKMTWVGISAIDHVAVEVE